MYLFFVYVCMYILCACLYVSVSIQASDVAELKRFCKEEWIKIPPQRCERLMGRYYKHLSAIVTTKDDTTGNKV